MKSKLLPALALAMGFLALSLLGARSVAAQPPYPVTGYDHTPTRPLTNPNPASFQPRYISGFGQDDAFTVFFEDRDAGGQISFNKTTSGPLGFSSTSTATNIADTHFLVKDWPVVISGTTYAYRAWASVGNNPQHHFYVSNDLVNWTTVSTFTIANSSRFTTARGTVYYGFHDVILLNGTYYAFAESNAGQTMIVSSTTGTDDWLAFDSIGGTLASDGPLQLPESGTPSGSFVPLAQDRGYGKIYVRGNDSGFYLAINTAAKPSLPPAQLEAAFISPDNWTWNNGATGMITQTTPIISATAEHDLRECWLVPQSNPDADWTIIYDADFGSADGGKALGYLLVAPSRPVDHFTFAPVGTQIEGRPFTITITARDAYGHRVPYTRPVALSDSTGTISPTVSGNFVGGVLTQTVVISAPQSAARITATHTVTPTITGASDPFDVLALRVTNLDTGERFFTIQEAIDDADTRPGHTISITTGVYTENVVLSKRLTLIGAGSGDDPLTATIIRQAANAPLLTLTASGLPTSPIRLQGLRLEPDAVYGLEIPAGQTVSYLTLDDVQVVGADGDAIESDLGFKVDPPASLFHLTVTDSSFENCDIGWYFAKHGDWGPGGSQVRY
ncbi:MAG TPA: hypothetical protein ENK17_05570, partial [Anaerolineae bacterium]|nr:hypothetical protein [Anaerolineae bacterium]